jgi:hypothetical protein
MTGMIIGFFAWFVFAWFVFGRKAFKFAVGPVLCLVMVDGAVASVQLTVQWSQGHPISGVPLGASSAFLPLQLSASNGSSLRYQAGGANATAYDYVEFNPVGAEAYLLGKVLCGTVGSDGSLIGAPVVCIIRWFPGPHKVEVQIGAVVWTAYETQRRVTTTNTHMVEIIHASSAFEGGAAADAYAGGSGQGYFGVLFPSSDMTPSSTQPTTQPGVPPTGETVEPLADGQDAPEILPLHIEQAGDFLDAGYVEGVGVVPGILDRAAGADATGEALAAIQTAFDEEGIPITLGLPVADADMASAFSNTRTFVTYFSPDLWYGGVGSGFLKDFMDGVGGAGAVIYAVMQSFDSWTMTLAVPMGIVRAACTVLLLFRVADGVMTAMCWGAKIDRPPWMGIPILFKLPFELLGGASDRNSYEGVPATNFHSRTWAKNARSYQAGGFSDPKS